MKKIILTIIFFLLTGSLNSQVQYMPLKVGNSWTYTVFHNMFYCCKQKFTITSDTLINGRRYYKTSASLPIQHVRNLGIRYYRLDSASGNFMGYIDSKGCDRYPNEIIIDSLSASINNITSICPDPNLRICTDIKTFPAPWGQSYTRKRFQYYNAGTQTATVYFLNFGLAGSTDGPLAEISYDIIGCVINGSVFGDTTLVGIINTSANIPDVFSLSQNYPNPFNPGTKIRFDITRDARRETQDVKLIVYNSLGKETTSLVNEKLSAREAMKLNLRVMISRAEYIFTNWKLRALVKQRE